MRQLYKSSTDKKVFGVCGGIAEYFGVDSTLLRVITVFLALVGTTGIWIYLFLGLLLPYDYEVNQKNQQKEEDSDWSDF